MRKKHRNQVCIFHDGCKQGIDQQIFNRKSISRKITHPQSLFKEKGRQFINGNSHHPQTTFKSFLVGEAIRLRRPKQRNDDYLSSLNRLKEKAIRSKFPLTMTNDMIALASNWEDRLRPPKCDKKEDPQVWATSFPHLLTLTQKEKKLNPKAMITFKRPTTIGQKLTNYKDLALNKTQKQTKGGSRPCEHCALCGCYGKNNKSMVPNVSQLLTKTKTFKLNQSLTCADFVIYVATCVICHEQYVGQTSNKFSKRWSAHNNNWNKQHCKTDSDKDQMALSRHYSENHGTINKPPLHEAYTVTFVEQPSCHSLDISENKWYHLIDAQINIQNMILPHVK